MAARRFIKMHGLGNDFVVVDARETPFAMNEAEARAVADRREGVGCDQIVILEPARRDDAAVYLRFLNADGSEVGACGNGTRCVAALLLAADGAEEIALETRAGLLRARAAGEGLVSVDMGAASFDWRDIPLAREMDTLHLDLALDGLTDPVATSMGNPHVTFFVPDIAEVPLFVLGPKLELDPLFPERANVGIAQVTGPETLRLRVWERGSGLTRACGSGACAAAVAAARRGLTGRRVRVVVDGGALDIAWREDGHVHMAGPTAIAFVGEVDPAALAAPS
jgi:diaminopimelate epimerase